MSPRECGKCSQSQLFSILHYFCLQCITPGCSRLSGHDAAFIPQIIIFQKSEHTPAQYLVTTLKIMPWGWVMRRMWHRICNEKAGLSGGFSGAVRSNLALMQFGILTRGECSEATPYLKRVGHSTSFFLCVCCLLSWGGQTVCTLMDYDVTYSWALALCDALCTFLPLHTNDHFWTWKLSKSGLLPFPNLQTLLSPSGILLWKQLSKTVSYI